MTDHSSGPWAWEEGTAFVTKDWNGKPRPIAAVARPEWHEDASCANIEAGANARLIAAAPDLLVQIKGLLGLAQFIISATDIDADLTTCVLRNKGEAVAEVPIALLLNNAQAAIAKAEGTP